MRNEHGPFYSGYSGRQQISRCLYPSMILTEPHSLWTTAQMLRFKRLVDQVLTKKFRWHRLHISHWVCFVEGALFRLGPSQTPFRFRARKSEWPDPHLSPEMGHCLPSWPAQPSCDLDHWGGRSWCLFVLVSGCFLGAAGAHSPSAVKNMCPVRTGTCCKRPVASHMPHAQKSFSDHETHSQSMVSWILVCFWCFSTACIGKPWGLLWIHCSLDVEASCGFQTNVGGGGTVVAGVKVRSGICRNQNATFCRQPVFFVLIKTNNNQGLGNPTDLNPTDLPARVVKQQLAQHESVHPSSHPSVHPSVHPSILCEANHSLLAPRVGPQEATGLAPICLPC